MKKGSVLLLALLVVAATSIECAAGRAPFNPYDGWGGKQAGVTLSDAKVEINIPTDNKKHRRVERFGSYLRGFMEAALLAKGAEVVSTGGELKVSVEVTDAETILMVTIRVTDQEGKVLGLITEKASLPKYANSSRNTSADEFFLRALELATRDAIMAF
jgi:hypothetical protein